MCFFFYFGHIYICLPHVVSAVNQLHEELVQASRWIVVMAVKLLCCEIIIFFL